MKLRLSVLILLLSGIISFTFADSKAESLKIAAVVNDEIISTRDLQNRVNLFLMTTRIPLNPQTKNMIFSRVLNNAIEEKIKLQAAEKEGIKISPQELADSVQQFEKNNQINTGELKKILAQNKVDMDAFENQMKADMAWVRLVRRKMYSDAQVTQKELEKAMADAKTDLSTPKYFVSEIYIRKKDAKDLSVLVNNLRQDPRFELYAMQFSQSPTAANGGRLGWLNKGKLPEEIEKKYGMTRVAIRSQVYRNNIPSKKEHGQIFYSKLHFDLSKQTTEEDSSDYYTVQEAMKKYNLTRDSVYGILQFHEIKREKKGRFVRFLKVEFDHIMGAR